MNSRVLRIKFSKYLNDELKSRRSRSLQELASRIGISTQKLAAILDDDWSYVTRDSIERTADYLNLSVTEVFEFQPIDFWKQIEGSGCTFLRGSRKATDSKDINIARADDDAINEVTTFLRGVIDEFRFADEYGDESKLIERVKNENCIVVGSPKSNDATEILLSRFFGAKPFDPRQENRFKIPFGFCWAESDSIAELSSLTCSALARRRTKNQWGIAIKHGIHVEADSLPRDEFHEKPIEEGRDCGVVFVANKPFGTERDVKLVVLAGFSGIGTLGAARALIRDFRQLEPSQNENCVYGVVQCMYRKPANSIERSLTDVRWRFREHGGAPLKPEKSKSSDRKRRSR